MSRIGNVGNSKIRNRTECDHLKEDLKPLKPILEKHVDGAEVIDTSKDSFNSQISKPPSSNKYNHMKNVNTYPSAEYNPTPTRAQLSVQSKASARILKFPNYKMKKKRISLRQNIIDCLIRKLRSERSLIDVSRSEILPVTRSSSIIKMHKPAPTVVDTNSVKSAIKGSKWPKLQTQNASKSTIETRSPPTKKIRLDVEKLVSLTSTKYSPLPSLSSLLDMNSLEKSNEKIPMLTRNDFPPLVIGTECPQGSYVNIDGIANYIKRKALEVDGSEQFKYSKVKEILEKKYYKVEYKEDYELPLDEDENDITGTIECLESEEKVEELVPNLEENGDRTTITTDCPIDNVNLKSLHHNCAMYVPTEAKAINISYEHHHYNPFKCNRSNRINRYAEKKKLFRLANTYFLDDILTNKTVWRCSSRPYLVDGRAFPVNEHDMVMGNLKDEIIEKVKTNGHIMKRSIILRILKERRLRFLKAFAKLKYEVDNKILTKSQLLMEAFTSEAFRKPLSDTELKTLRLKRPGTNAAFYVMCPKSTVMPFPKEFEIWLKSFKGAQPPDRGDDGDVARNIPCFTVPTSNQYEKAPEIKEKKSNFLDEIWRLISKSKIYYTQYFQRMVDTGNLNSIKNFDKKLPQSPYIHWLKYFLTDVLHLNVDVRNETTIKGDDQKAIFPSLLAAPIHLKIEKKIVCFLCYLEPLSDDYQLYHKNNSIKSYYTKSKTYSTENLNFKYPMFAWLAGLHAYVKFKKKTPFNIQVAVFPHPIYDSETLEKVVKEHKDFFQCVDLFIQTNGINPTVKKPSTVWASNGLCHFRLKLTLTSTRLSAEDSKAEINKYLLTVLDELNKWCKAKNQSPDDILKNQNIGILKSGTTEKDSDKKYMDNFEVNLESVQPRQDENFFVEIKFNIPYWKKEQQWEIKHSIGEIVSCWSEKQKNKIECQLEMDYYSNPWYGKKQDHINDIAKNALFKVTQEVPINTLNENPLQLAEILQRLFDKTVLAIWCGKGKDISANSMRSSCLIQSMKVVAAIIKGIHDTKPDFLPIDPKMLEMLNKYKVPKITVMNQLMNHYDFKSFKQARDVYWNVFMMLRGILVSSPQNEKISTPQLESRIITQFLLEYTAANGKKYSTSCCAEDEFIRCNDYILQAIRIENYSGNKRIKNKMKNLFLEILKHKKYISDVLQKFCKFYNMPDSQTFESPRKNLEDNNVQITDFNEIKQGILLYKNAAMYGRQFMLLDKDPFTKTSILISIPPERNKKIDKYFTEMIKRALPKKKDIKLNLSKLLANKYDEESRRTKTSKLSVKTSMIIKKSSAKDMTRYIDHLENFTFNRANWMKRPSNLSIMDKKKLKSNKWFKEFKKVKEKKINEKALIAEKIILSSEVRKNPSIKSSKPDTTSPIRLKKQNLTKRDGSNTPVKTSSQQHTANVGIFDEQLKDSSKVKNHSNKIESTNVIISYATGQFDRGQFSFDKVLDTSSRKHINKKWLKMINLCRKCKTKPLMEKRDSPFIKQVKKLLKHIYIDRGRHTDLIFKHIVHDTLGKNNKSRKINIIKKILKYELAEQDIMSHSEKNLECAADKYSSYLEFCLLHKKNFENLLREWQYKNVPGTAIKLPEKLETDILKMLSKKEKYFVDGKNKSKLGEINEELPMNVNIFEDKIQEPLGAVSIAIRESKAFSSDPSLVSVQVDTQSELLQPSEQVAICVPYTSLKWRFMFKFARAKCELLFGCYTHVNNFYNREYKHLYQRMITERCGKEQSNNYKILENLSSFLAYNKNIFKIHSKLFKSINKIEEIYLNKPEFFDHEWLSIIKSSLQKPPRPPNFNLKIESKQEEVPFNPAKHDISAIKKSKVKVNRSVNKNASGYKVPNKKNTAYDKEISKDIQMETIIRECAQRRLNRSYKFLCSKYKKIMAKLEEIDSLHQDYGGCFFTEWIQLMITLLKPCSTLKAGLPRKRLRNSTTFPIHRLISNRKTVLRQWKLFYDYFAQKYNIVSSILKRIKLNIHKHSKAEKSSENVTNKIDKNISTVSYTQSNPVPIHEELDESRKQNAKSSFKKSTKIHFKKKSVTSTIHDFSNTNIMKCFSFFYLNATKFKSIWSLTHKLNKNLNESKESSKELSITTVNPLNIQPQFMAEEYFKGLRKLFYNVAFLLYKLSQIRKVRELMIPEKWQEYIKCNFKLTMPEDLVDEIVRDRSDKSIMFMAPASQGMDLEAEPDALLNLIKKLSSDASDSKKITCSEKYFKVWQGIDFANVKTSIDRVIFNVSQLRDKIIKLIAKKKLLDNYSGELDSHLVLKKASFLNWHINKCCILVDNYMTFATSLKQAFLTLLPYIETNYVKDEKNSELYCIANEFPERLLCILSDIEKEINILTSYHESLNCKDCCCPCKDICTDAKDKIPHVSENNTLCLGSFKGKSTFGTDREHTAAKMSTEYSRKRNLCLDTCGGYLFSKNCNALKFDQYLQELKESLCQIHTKRFKLMLENRFKNGNWRDPKEYVSCKYTKENETEKS